MLTILLYLFHSRRPAGGLRSRGRGFTDSTDLTDFTDFSVDDGLRGREPRVFSALSSFKKSCFRISNNLLQEIWQN